jgi:hypothetical protein
MKLMRSVYKLYQDIGKKVLTISPDNLKVVCRKHFQDQTGGFSISLEIIVVDRVNNDDYGIVLTTNAQQNSHYEKRDRHFKAGLYLMSDLSYGDGGIIVETNEVNYLPSNEESSKTIWSFISDFSLSKVEMMQSILLNKYGI